MLCCGHRLGGAGARDETKFEITNNTRTFVAKTHTQSQKASAVCAHMHACITTSGQIPIHSLQGHFMAGLVQRQYVRMLCTLCALYTRHIVSPKRLATDNTVSAWKWFSGWTGIVFVTITCVAW